MRKVLYITSTLRRTGPTAQLYSVIKYLDRDQFDPYIVTLSPELVDARWEDFKSLDIKLSSLSLSRASGLFLARSKLHRVIDTIQPHIIHSQGVRGDILVSKLDMRIPKMCTIHCYPQLDYLMTYGWLVGQTLNLLHRKAMRRMDQCVGVSSAVCKNLSVNLGVSNTVPIPNGVDTQFYFPVDEEKKYNLRNKLGLPQKCCIWISSGHLSARKDPLSILKAFREAYKDSKSHFLVFIGHGPLETEVVKMAANASNVLVKGRVSNVADWLRASDYFVSASMAEGLPYAVIEALACGLPVLLSDIEPHCEILDIDNKIGLVFRQGCERALSEGFLNMLDKKYEEMRYFANNVVVDKLSASIMSLHYQDVYRQLVET